MKADSYGHYELPKNRRFLDLLVRVADLEGARTVLDAGCGYGYLSRFLADHIPARATVVGMDVSERFLETARTLADDRLTFVKGTLVALPFPDGAFDLVVCNSVIEHIPHTLRAGALREIVRVLCESGTAVIGVPTSLHKLWTLPHLTFHDKHVLGVSLTQADLACRRAWRAHWREVLALPYLLVREFVDHWPGRWKRFFSTDLPVKVERRGMNLFSNRSPLVECLEEWESRLSALRGFRDLGTSMVFIMRKASACAYS